MSARAVENPVNYVFDLLGGVGWSEREATALEDNQIRKIISDEGDFVGLGRVSLEKTLKSGAFLIDTHVHGLELQLGSASLQRRRVSAREDADLEARQLCHFESEPVTGIETQKVVAVSVVVQAAVGQDTVRIAEDPLEGGYPPSEVGLGQGRHGASEEL